MASPKLLMFSAPAFRRNMKTHLSRNKWAVQAARLGLSVFLSLIITLSSAPHSVIQFPTSLVPPDRLPLLEPVDPLPDTVLSDLVNSTHIVDDVDIDAHSSVNASNASSHAHRISAANGLNLCALPHYFKTVQLRQPQDELPPSIRNYVEWHRRVKPCIVDPSLCNGRQPPILIWRCPLSGKCAGIGDRIRGIRFSFMLAILTRRVLLIDWPASRVSLFPLEVAFSPAVIDWRVPPKLQHASFRKGKWPTLPWFNLHDGTDAMEFSRGFPEQNGSQVIRTFSLGKEPFVDYFDDAQPLIVATNIHSVHVDTLVRNPHFAPRFEDLQPTRIPHHTLQRLITQTLFHPTDAVAHHARALTGLSPATDSFIAVHVRTGIDAGETHETRFHYINRNSRDIARRLLLCAQRLQQRLASDEKKVFLAADSVSFKQEFEHEARAQDVDVRTFKEKTVHLARMKSNRTANQGKRALCAAFLNVFADLYMLSRGDAIVSTGSGFSLTAFFLGDGEMYKVYDVQHKQESC